MTEQPLPRRLGHPAQLLARRTVQIRCHQGRNRPGRRCRTARSAAKAAEGRPTALRVEIIGYTLQINIVRIRFLKVQ